MSDTMQPIDETLDDESLDAVDTEAAEAYEEIEEFDPFEGMSDEEYDHLKTVWNDVQETMSQGNVNATLSAN